MCVMRHSQVINTIIITVTTTITITPLTTGANKAPGGAAEKTVVGRDVTVGRPGKYGQPGKFGIARTAWH
jgi:hypothetical protein